MRWKFWEIDLHHKRTYQSYLPGTTPVKNTLMEAIVGVIIYFTFYVGTTMYGYTVPMRSAFLGLGFFIVIWFTGCGVKNWIKWQRLDRQLAEKHRKIDSKTAGSNGK